MKATKHFWITIVAAIFIDYLIAKFLASDDSDTIFIFSLLIGAPMLFSLKSTAVRYFLRQIIGSSASVENYFQLMMKYKWPKPNAEYEDAINYMQRIVEDDELDLKAKIVAAQLLGAIQALFDTQQVMSSWFQTSDFKSAMKKYEKQFV